jgi:hypothetical protein
LWRIEVWHHGHVDLDLAGRGGRVDALHAKAAAAGKYYRTVYRMPFTSSTLETTTLLLLLFVARKINSTCDTVYL